MLASEIDKFANKSYECLYGEPTAGDITKIPNEDIPSHDLLAAGFPCQTFSFAGARRGFQDTRGTLFFEVARIAKEKRPAILLLENVKGLLSHDHTNTVQTILSTLDDIGYYTDIRILNSVDFNLPQKRERLYFVCVRKDLITNPFENEPHPASVKIREKLPENITSWFNFNWPLPIPLTLTVADIMDDLVAKHYYIDASRMQSFVPIESFKRAANVDCLGGFRTSLWIPNAKKSLSRNFRQGYRLYNAEHYAPTVTSSGGGLGGCAGMYLVKAKKKQGKYISQPFDFRGTPIQLLFPEDIGEQYPIEDAEDNEYYIRRATPEEAVRMQGFPENVITALSNSDLSMTKYYKQAGNAVSVPIVRSLAENCLPYIQASQTINKGEYKNDKKF